MKPLGCLLPCLLLAIAGCSQPGAAYPTRAKLLVGERHRQPPSGRYALAGKTRRTDIRSLAASVAEPTGPGLNLVAMDGAVTTLASTNQPEPARSSAAAGMSRKIIYDAQVDLIVESVEPVAKKVTSFVQDGPGVHRRAKRHGFAWFTAIDSLEDPHSGRTVRFLRRVGRFSGRARAK